MELREGFQWIFEARVRNIQSVILSWFHVIIHRYPSARSVRGDPWRVGGGGGNREQRNVSEEVSRTEGGGGGVMGTKKRFGR